MGFVKGQSGNPGGRPKVRLSDGRKLSDLAKEHTEAAVKALARIVKSGDSDAVIVSAATALLDRAYGRPRQDMGVEMTISSEIASRLEEARKRAQSQFNGQVNYPPIALSATEDA